MTQEDKYYLKSGFEVLTWNTAGSIDNPNEGYTKHCLIRGLNTTVEEPVRYKVQTKTKNTKMSEEDLIKQTIDIYFKAIDEETIDLIKIDYQVGSTEWTNKIVTLD